MKCHSHGLIRVYSNQCPFCYRDNIDNYSYNYYKKKTYKKIEKNVKSMQKKRTETINIENTRIKDLDNIIEKENKLNEKILKSIKTILDNRGKRYSNLTHLDKCPLCNKNT